MMRYILILVIELLVSSVSAQSELSNNLFAQGVDLYNNNKYSEAIPFFIRVQELDSREIDYNSSRASYGNLWLAACYYKLGNIAKAKEISPYEYMLNPIDRRLTIESDKLSDQGLFFYYAGNYEKALDFFIKCAEYEKKVIGRHSFYGNSLLISADCLIYLGDFEKAKSLLHTVCAIYHEDGYNHGLNGYLNKMGLCYQGLNQLDSAYYCFDKAYHGFMLLKDSLNAASSRISALSCKRQKGELDIQSIATIDSILTIYETSELIGKHNISYATALYEKAVIYYVERNIKAESLFIEVKNIMEENGIKNGYDYDMIEYFLLGCVYFFHNSNNAYHIAIDVRKKFEEDGLTLVPEYLDIVHLCVLSGIACQQVTEEEAIAEERKILEIAKENFGTSNDCYVRSLLYLADILQNDSPELSHRLINEAYGIVEGSNTLTPQTIVLVYRRKAQIYVTDMKLNDAAIMFENAYEVFQESNLPYSADYIELLRDMVMLYSNTDRLDKASRTGEQILAIYKKIGWRADLTYVQTLECLQNVYDITGNIKRLRELIEETKKTYQNNPHLHKDLFLYSSTLQREGNLAIYDGKYEIAQRNADEMLEFVKKEQSADSDTRLVVSTAGKFLLIQYYIGIGEIEHSKQIAQSLIDNEFINVSNNQLTSVMNLWMKSIIRALKDNNFEEAITFMQQAYQKYSLFESGDNNIMRLHMLNALSTYALYSDNQKQLQESVSQQNLFLRNFVCSHFLTMTYQERCIFWNKYKGWFEQQIPNGVYRLPCDTFLCEAYNSTLLSKSILLSSEIEIKKLINESGNKEIQQLYTQTIRHKRELSEWQSERQDGQRDSLEILYQQEEKNMMYKLSEELGDYTRCFNLTWKDIVQQLKKDEIAIEFIKSPLSLDSIMYSALFLKKDMNAPKLIPLFEEKQLPRGERIYKDVSVSKLIWEPLSKYLEGMHNIYFAPTGELFNIGIENLPHWSEDCIMSDKWNIYRLSSTRELVISKKSSSIERAVVYGGINYNISIDMQTDSSHNTDFSEKREGHHEPLEGTKKEADKIYKLLNHKNISTTLYEETKATEGSVKDLSGQRVNLLHIGTHGFYFPESEVQFWTNLDFLHQFNNESLYVEDKTLTRSGLVFSGANNTWEGKKVLLGVDDGYLTAQEISRLDLRGLDLVVLAACKTGLGEIKGDGVFGLQRGFKKAGANSLLMTLWDVNDEVTSLLMSQFYKNLLSGRNKSESLRQAQIITREKYPNPKDWAGFILLDAIN